MQVIAITGASDGIGAEMARHGAGPALLLAARSEEKLAQVGAQCVAAAVDLGGDHAGVGDGHADALRLQFDTCARLIIDGMEQRRREVVMSAKGKLARWLEPIAPGRVDALAALSRDGSHGARR